MRVYNFSAGPSMLPLPVLEKVQKQLINYEGCGMSVMEMSHRGKQYMEINAAAEERLRKLMNIPDSYAVLFLQGGASLQFAAIPLNLAATHKKTDYIITGNFAKKAFQEAALYTDAFAAASSADKNFTYIPQIDAKTFRKDIDYAHICYNNTIFGTRYDKTPNVGKVALVADVSSCILSQNFNVTDFACLYAGAQKNVGPAGTTIVIVRRDLINNPMSICPNVMRYKTQDENDSLYNTPPCFTTYVASEVFAYVESLGGISAVEKINVRKASKLYDFIDNSAFYANNVEKPYRSIMNVPFVTPSKELDEKFVKEAAANGLVSLKGHRLVGGMRASIYNAMPEEGVDALIAFMKKFESDNA